MGIDNLIAVRHLDTKKECIGRYGVTITFDRQGVGDDIYIYKVREVAGLEVSSTRRLGL